MKKEGSLPWAKAHLCLGACQGGCTHAYNSKYLWAYSIQTTDRYLSHVAPIDVIDVMRNI